MLLNTTRTISVCISLVVIPLGGARYYLQILTLKLKTRKTRDKRKTNDARRVFSEITTHAACDQLIFNLVRNYHCDAHNNIKI